MAIVQLPLPIQLINGNVADGGEVMSDMNAIASNVNANAAKNGVNSDITALTALVSINSGVNIDGASITNSTIQTSTIDGTNSGETQPLGTSNLTLATTEFVANTAFSSALPAQAGFNNKYTVSTDGTNAFWQLTLPAQAGNAGKFLTTDGTNESWAFAAISSVNAVVTTDTTISGTNVYVPIQMATLGKSVTLPNATALTPTAPMYFMDNRLGAYSAGIRDSTGQLIAVLPPESCAYVNLKTGGTQAGSWTVLGNKLSPGLITIDSTFSTTFNATTVFAPWCAFDTNTSLHFVALASGFAAFAVDNAGKVLTTPVTVDATASSTPKQAFQITSTTAIVFYGESATANKAVVISLTGSSPTFSLTLGTPASTATDMGSNWGAEDSVSAPRIAQLSPVQYQVVFGSAGTGSTLAVQVNVTTITIGAPAVVATPNFGNSGATIVPLTATTAFIIYQNNTPAPFANIGVVVSVAGVVSTINTPTTATGCATSSTAAPPVTAQLSATKVLINVNNNTTTSKVGCFTISGVTTTFGGTGTIVEAATTGPSNFSDGGSTRFNNRLSVLSATTAVYWHISGAASRTAVITESAGAVTAGTLIFRSFNTAGSTSAGAGFFACAGTTEFMTLKQYGVASAYVFKAIPHKVVTTNVTVGDSYPLTDLSPLTAVGSQVYARLGSGDYLLGLSTGGNALNVVRSNGDEIDYRGFVTIPEVTGISFNVAKPSNNRAVLMGGIADYSSLNSAGTTPQLRLVNVEFTV